MSEQPGEIGTTFAPPPRVGRTSMALRHLVSVVVALVVAPPAMLVLDYGAGEYDQRVQVMATRSMGTFGDLALICAGGVGLLVVAAVGRVSGLGPLVAGMLYAVVPFGWYAADPSGFFRASVDLPSTHLWFSAAAYELPLIGALLIGAAIAGRWSRRTGH